MDLLLASDDDPRGTHVYVAETARPPGPALQWLRLRFRSDGLLSRSPGSHLAIALRARLGYSPQGVPETISGRGLAVGDTSDATPPPGHPLSDRPGFGGARGATIESFWPRGNFLYRSAAVLPQGLEERRWYRIALEVDDARWIRYRICDAQGHLLHPPGVAMVQDAAAHPVVADATGVLIGLGRDLREHGPWSAELRDIEFGWRALPGETAA